LNNYPTRVVYVKINIYSINICIKMDNIEEFNKFLKKYSTIPNSFIDDFFSFYKYDTDENDIIIDLNLVAKWLNMRKDNLKKTLIRSYIEDFDYKIIINKTNNIGRPVEDIFI